MTSKLAGAVIAALLLATGCSNSRGGGGTPIPAAVVDALQQCTSLRTINLVAIAASLQEELQGAPALPIDIGLDGDGSDDVTVSGTLDLIGGTLDWTLSGDLTGSGTFTFAAGASSLTLSGGGTVTAADGCSLTFDIPGQLTLSDRGIDGSLGFTVVTGVSTLQGTLRFTEGSTTVQATNLQVTTLDELENEIRASIPNFTFQIPLDIEEPPPGGGSLGQIDDFLFAQKVRHPTTGSDNYQLFTIGDDGMGLARITDNDVRDRTPAFSYDGAFVAFASNRHAPGSDNYEIYIVERFAGGEPERITFVSASSGAARRPAWDPGGTTLAFRSGGDIWTIQTFIGAVPMQLTSGAAFDDSPTFSPDGQRIAFTRDGELWVMSADGSNQISLGVFASAAAWSPTADGIRIAYLGGSGVEILEDDESVTMLGDAFGEWIAWNPGGTGVAVLEFNQIRVFDDTSGPTEARIIPVGGETDETEGLAWYPSPAG